MEHLCCVVERMGFDYPEITQLIVTQDMSERKAKMVELGDAFIAFPGGTGTLEEISEIMSKVVLGHLDAPCIVYNLNGYYDDLRRLLNHMVEMELVPRILINWHIRLSDCSYTALSSVVDAHINSLLCLAYEQSSCVNVPEINYSVY